LKPNITPGSRGEAGEMKGCIRDSVSVVAFFRLQFEAGFLGMRFSSVVFR
jgi:hypothetical protein